MRELPDDDEAARHLDDRVEPEANEGDGAGNEAGRDGDDGFDDVVGDGCAGEELGPASEPRSVLGTEDAELSVAGRGGQEGPVSSCGAAMP